MDVYARLGVKRRINAAGTLTRLGGNLMAPEVLEAMREAAGASVDIAELQAAASAAIAAATGAEAGIVTSGAAAALTLATAACITGTDVAKMEALPDTAGFASDVLMIRTHRNAYDHAIRAAGARIVDIGNNDRGTGAGVRGIEPWEIEAAITPRTVAFAFVATPQTRADLARVVAACRPRGVPVIVDAAAQLPPKANLRTIIADGADLVAFSGGKAIGGPQSSGLLAGRQALIGAALIQQLDMDVTPETWTPPALINRNNLSGVPHHGLGRGFKVGKEEIVGLLAALQRFVAGDDAARNAALADRLERIAATLDGADGLAAALVPATKTGRVPVLEIAIDRARLRIDAIELSRRLQAGDPPVHLGERRAGEDVLIVDPSALREGDDLLLAARIVDVAAAAPRGGAVSRSATAASRKARTSARLRRS
jgi:L-seryl-tRNA(Ser) seleniumtransferase